MKESTRVEKLEPFSVLELEDVFEVYLIQDSIFSVSISGMGETPEHISIIRKYDTLNISNHAKSKWLHPETNKVRLFVHADRLSSIFAHATCYFETIDPIISDQFSLLMSGETKLMEGKLNLNCNSFLYWNSHLCGGKLTLTGNVNSLAVYTFATASVDASNLTANYVHVENNSKGDSKFFVTTQLEYSIRGTGNIYLYGNPPEIILAERTSSGQLILQ
jgi:hypothetical protein